MNATRSGAVLLAALLVATPALAHVPAFPGDNDSPERAVAVEDATKSRSFYDRLSAGQVAYYRLSLSAGQRLRVGTFTPRGGAFTPSIVLMSPSLDRNGTVPPGVTVPDGMGVRVIEGERPGEPTYEPFAPSANYPTASVDRRVAANATYLVAVYEPANRSGPVGVAIGSEESFTPAEYLLVALDLLRVHRWAGQHPLVVLAPWLAVAVGGATLVRNRRREGWKRPLVRTATGGAAVLILGSAASTALQMAIALSKTGPAPGAAVTAAFVAVPAVAGGWTLRVAVDEEFALTRRRRAGLVLASAAALATWAGVVVGPVALLVVAATPRRAVE